MLSNIPNQNISKSQLDLINKIIQKEISKTYLDIKDEMKKKILDYENRTLIYLNELSEVNLLT